MNPIRVNSENDDFIKLTSMLDAELRMNYQEKQKKYDKYNVFSTPINTVIIKTNDAAIACGAFKQTIYSNSQ